MSLINNMLKELEKREGGPPEVTYIPFVQAHTESDFFHSRGKVFFTITAILAVILLTTTLYFNKKNKLLIQPLPAEQRQITPPATDESAWLKPAAITGITLQVKDNITEITFLLNHPVLYRLVTDGMHNQLSIIIEHAELQSELPPVNYLNTALQRINAQYIKGDTKFVLTTTSHSRIKYINLNNSDANPELVVAIESQAPEHNTDITQSSKAIKVPAMQNLLLQQYQAALLDAEGGHYQSAIQHLTSLLKIDAGFKDARASLTALLIDQGNQLKAKQIVDAGLNESPNHIPFIELKARILAAEGKPKQALTLLQTASPRLEENPDYHAFVAAMYEQNNNYTLAAALYRQLLALNNSNSSWWFGLGVSLDKLGKKQAAIQAYNKATAEGHLNADSLAYLQNRLQLLQETIDDTE